MLPLVTEKREELLSVQILRLRQLKLLCSYNASLDVPDRVPIILCGLLSAGVTEILIGDAWRHLQQSVHLPKFGKFTACRLEVREAQVVELLKHGGLTLISQQRATTPVMIGPNCRSFTTPSLTSLMLRSARCCSNVSNIILSASATLDASGLTPQKPHMVWLHLSYRAKSLPNAFMFCTARPHTQKDTSIRSGFGGSTSVPSCSSPLPASSGGSTR